MKLSLVRTKEVNNKKVEIYEIADYEVKVVIYEDGTKYITVRETRGGYVPTIYCRTNDDNGDILGFEIQTTSYGALSVEEISKLVNDLEEATQVAEILTAEFVK